MAHSKTNSRISCCSCCQICALKTGGFSGPSHSALFRKGIILYRVPKFGYSRLNWVPPPPSPQASVAPPKDPSEREPHSLAGEVVEGSNADDWTKTFGTLYIV
jgi:hypothetical protein